MRTDLPATRAPLAMAAGVRINRVVIRWRLHGGRKARFLGWFYDPCLAGPLSLWLANPMLLGPKSGNVPELFSPSHMVKSGLMPSPTQRHVLSALVQNVPGVLAHISGMLASRGFNIDSLAVGETENPVLSRMTFVVVGDNRVLEQVRKQLEKIVTVVKVIDVSASDYVERDLLLVKVQAPSGPRRAEIRELVDIFRGRIVDVGPEELMIEISGRENKVQAFIERVRPYGITELVRTGRVAMVRSDSSAAVVGESSRVIA